MASTDSYITYVYEQIAGMGDIRYRKMFGEYGFYYQDIFFGMVCDDRFIIKITDAGKTFLGEYKTAEPYKGGKSGFLIEDLDNVKKIQELIAITCQHLPKSKPKKKKK